MLKAHAQPDRTNSPTSDMLAMLHGIFGMSSNLLGLARALKDEMYPISYDLPNHGHSPTLADCNFLSITEMLDRSIARDKPAFDSRIHLLGHSLGGKVMAVYALLYPEKTQSLAILDIAPADYPPLHLEIFEVLRELLKNPPENREQIIKSLSQCTDAGTAAFLAKSFELAIPSSGKPFKSLLRVEELYSNYRTLMTFPYKHLEGMTYTGPVILLRASRGSAFYEEGDEKNVYQYFPNCRIITIPDTGHNLHTDNPRAVVATLREFWAH